MPMVRVSERAMGVLRALAEAEHRTMTAVLDQAVADYAATPPAPTGCLPVPVPVRSSGASAPGRNLGVRPSDVAHVDSLPRCPRCGCIVAMHEAGTGKDRCERHPTCRWTP